MKRLGFLFFLAVIVVEATGCMVQIPSTPTQTPASHYDVVVDNQTSSSATLIVDGDKRQNVPASEISKFEMNGTGRLFTVKFSDGKSFHRKMRTCCGDMVIATISLSSSSWRGKREKRQVRWEKSQGEREQQPSVSYYWPAPYPSYPYGYGYGYSHRWNGSYRWRVR